VLDEAIIAPDTMIAWKDGYDSVAPKLRQMSQPAQDSGRSTAIGRLGHDRQFGHAGQPIVEVRIGPVDDDRGRSQWC
jgi:hypothetical protein